MNSSLKLVAHTRTWDSPACYIQSLIRRMDKSIECPALAGRVAHFQTNWELLTQDKWVLQTVAGYQLELLGVPYQARHPPPTRVSLENQAQISAEVSELLSKGAITETRVSTDQFVSQLFLVEKKDGGQRPVINLKGLNQYVKVEHFKMEGLHLLPDLIQAGDWMVKLDLKDAYLQIPIHPDHQKYLVFQWDDKFYQFTCLPFGLSAAPRAFTKLLKPIVGFLRQIGCHLIIYLDNILILHQDNNQLHQITLSACQLFEHLGLLVNNKKSVLTPCQQLEFLGFQLCTMTLRISVPSEKMRKIQQDATRIITREQVQLRDVARFVGKVVAIVRAFPTAPLHYRAL